MSRIVDPVGPFCAEGAGPAIIVAKGRGGTGVEATHNEDMLRQLGALQYTKPPRIMVADAFGTSFRVIGLPTPTIHSPGAAPFSLVSDDNGSFVSLTYDYALASPCGIDIPAVTQERFKPDIGILFYSALVNSRFWFGAFSASPHASATLSAISGVGMRTVSGGDNLVHMVSSSGSAETDTATTLPTAALRRVAWRLRNTGGNVWEFLDYDFDERAWVSVQTQSLTSPASSTTLGIYAKLTTDGASDDKVFSPMILWLDDAD